MLCCDIFTNGLFSPWWAGDGRAFNMNVNGRASVGKQPVI
jgi:hypothetical protein